MNILVCGSCLPQEFEGTIKDLAAASNQYHLNMISALQKLGDVKVLSYIGMNLNGVSESSIAENAKNSGIECVFKKGKPANAFREYQSRLDELLPWADIVITYNIQFVWFGIAKKAKKHGAKSVLVWADHTPLSDRTGIGSKVYGYLSEVNCRKYDKIVALSPNMKCYATDKQEFTVSHGCLKWNVYENFTAPKKKEKVQFMFSGLLAPVTGADLLIEALKYIHSENIRIVVTGKGRTEIENTLKEDSRVDFLGFVSREQYISLLQEADVLINPRNMNLPENVNNFPSKMLEFLASGRKIISTRFPGYDNFEENCVYVDSTPQAIAAAIDKLADGYESDMDTYKRNRDVARKFDWDSEILRFI